MGDRYKEKWIDALPWVLLGHRSSFQEELDCSPFQMVFGQAAVLPGAIVDDPGLLLKKAQLQDLLKGLEAQNDRHATPMSRHSLDEKIYTKDIDVATHLKVDNPGGLQPRYHGPYAINKRHGSSTIKVKTGT